MAGWKRKTFLWLRRSLLKASALYQLLDTQLQRVGGTRRQIVGLLAHRGRRKGKANRRGQEPVNFFSALLMDCTHQSLLWTLWPPMVRRNLWFSMLGTTSIYRCTRRKWTTNFWLIFVAYKFAALTYCVADIFPWFGFVGRRRGHMFFTLITGWISPCPSPRPSTSGTDYGLQMSGQQMRWVTTVAFAILFRNEKCLIIVNV